VVNNAVEEPAASIFKDMNEFYRKNEGIRPRGMRLASTSQRLGGGDRPTSEISLLQWNEVAQKMTLLSFLESRLKRIT
jgi:hypothetical protein